MRKSVRFRLDVAVRVFADTLMLGISAFAALSVHFLSSAQTSSDAFRNALQLLGPALMAVIPVGIGTAGALGLYTGTRGYDVLPKAVRVSQAATAAFAIVGVLRYAFSIEGLLPGRSLVIGWLLALTLMNAGRIWARIWEYLVLTDASRTAVSTRLREKNVLLIGGAGYIGSALLPKLLANGYKVRLLDSFVYGEEPIADWLHHKNLEVFRTDFRQVDKVVEAMQGMGTVIHLGAIVGDPACALNEELTIEVNLVATRMIAEVAKGAGVSRFVFASTCSVYGLSDNLLDERSHLNPVSLYARSKIACEQVLLGMKDESFLPVVLRFGTIYGLSGRTRFDLVVNLLAAKALVDGEFTVFGSDQWRPFVHVDDASRAVLLATEATRRDLNRMIFNVGSDDQNLTLAQVGALVVQKVPTAKMKIVNENVDKRNYRVNFRRIREDLGFLPLWSVSDGVDQVLHAIRSGAVRDYRISKYSNLTFLKEQGRDVLKVQNGWAKDLIENGWMPEPLSAESSAIAMTAGD